MCNEVGIQLNNAKESENSVEARRNFKLVLAEPLTEGSTSHVQKFLDDHGGPGLQHIGLSTENVVRTVGKMRKRGAEFRSPPPTYYQLVSLLY